MGETEHVKRSGPAPFEGVRVVDLTSGIAGGYAAKLFVDAGADVVRVEPPGGSPLRRWVACGAHLGDTGTAPDAAATDGAGSAATSHGPLFGFLAAGTRSVVRAGGFDDTVLEGADLVFTDDRDAPVERWRARWPSLVVVSVTPFGLTGPWRDRAATEFTLQALTGGLLGRGTADLPPVQAGGRIGEWGAGLSAALGAAAALRTAARTGRGEHVDVSTHESMMLVMVPYLFMYGSYLGWPDVPMVRTIESPGVEATADGWVGFCCNTYEQSRAFWELVERPDLAEVQEWLQPGPRANRRDELVPAWSPWLQRHTTDEVVELASARRIPVVPVCDGRTITRVQHLVERGVFERGVDGVLQPRVPYAVGDRPRPRPGPVPVVGSSASTGWEPRPVSPAPVEGSDAVTLPLAGLRVLDFTTFWAGPFATALLGALGADVVKVEGPGRMDNMRLSSAVPLTTEQWWERVPVFAGTNTNKRGITIDLTRPEGVALAERLVTVSDVVIENFTPRVIEKFGLGWERVHQLNPQAVMVRMPAFGLSGPWRERPGFAQNMEQLTGMVWVTGHPHGQPVNPRGPCDPLAGLTAAFATFVALAAREADGEGSLVEAAMVESILNVVAESIVEADRFGVVAQRQGNRGPTAAPQGLYECRDGSWLAVAVETDEHWQALVGALGDPDWAGDPELATSSGRRRRHDELDGHLGRWAALRDGDEAEGLLVARGVPAAVATNSWNLHHDPHLAARRFFEPVEHPVAGTHGLPRPPWTFASLGESFRWVRRPSPLFGEHVDEVLSELLGMGATDIAALRSAGVVGGTPFPAG